MKKILKCAGIMLLSMLFIDGLNIKVNASELRTQKETSNVSNQDVRWVDRGDAINIGENNEWEGVIDDDGTVMITGSNTLDWASDGVLEIPSNVDGMMVDSVGGYQSGFGIMSPEVITTIKFPDTVTQIENKSFSKFINLETAYLPDNEEYEGIDTWTNPFEGCTNIKTVYANNYPLDHDDFRCNIVTITYYDGIKKVDGKPRFDVDEWSNLTTINLPSSIEQFGWRNAPKLSFLNCSKSIEQIKVTSTANCPNLCIPVNAKYDFDPFSEFYNSGITKIYFDSEYMKEDSIYKNTFANCPNLTSIEVDDPTGTFHSEDGVLWKNNDLVAYPAGKSWVGNYNVPENVECIWLFAFDSCKFTMLTFPENINANYYWDSDNYDVYGRDSIIENTNISKVKIIKGSAPVEFYSTESALAERLGLDASQVEFYLGNTYKVSYNLNGGTNASDNPISYRAGSDPIALKNPTREGYVFLGWKRNDVLEGYENTTARRLGGYFEDYTFTACWSIDLTYNDVDEGSWFYNSVQYVYDNGLMTGLNETTFGPYENLARAQFAVILHRMNGSPDMEYTNKFPDVADNQWYTDAILWANEAGVVGGYTDTGKFGPGDNINREQMAVMMYRYANYLGYDTSARADISKYTDAGNVNGFAKEAVSWAVGEGIITGKENGTKLDPQGNASRAECATIIMRFIENYKSL